MKKRNMLVVATVVLVSAGLLAPTSSARPGNSAQKANTEGFDWGVDEFDEPIVPPPGFEKAVLLSNDNLVAFSVHAETTASKGNSSKTRPTKGDTVLENATNGRIFTTTIDCVWIDENKARFSGTITETNNDTGATALGTRRHYDVEDNSAAGDPDRFQASGPADSGTSTNCGDLARLTETSPTVEEGRIKVFSS